MTKKAPDTSPRDVTEITGMTSQQEETFERILATLMNKTDIALKSDYENALAITRLHSIAQGLYQVLGKKSQTAKFLETVVTDYSERRVSQDRKGRGEIVHAVSEMMKQPKSISDKLNETP